MAERRRPVTIAVLLGLVLAWGCGNAPNLDQTVRATETVWCADSDGAVDMVTVDGHDGPLSHIDAQVVELGGQVTEEDLLDACSRPLGGLGTATLCEAYADASAVERVAASGSVVETHGEVTGDRPGFPVVVRGDAQCGELTLEVDQAAADGAGDASRTRYQARAWTSTEALNEWRSAEARLQDAADGGCLDTDDARDLALAASEELEGDWPVLDFARDADDPMHVDLCFDVRLDRAGFLRVQYHRLESPGGPRVPEDASEPDRADP